jgi:farnesyl diphosphate synthase
MDFDTERLACAEAVEDGLRALLDNEPWAGPGQPPERLVAAMRHATLGGGKRLRPLLVRQAAAVFGVRPQRALAAGLAVELIHCYSLVHDDLPAMDDDDLRRGQPTVHKAFDESTAILAGDALLTLAFHWMAGSAHADAVVRAKMVVELAEAAGPAGMVGGQQRDIEGEAMTLEPGDIDYMQSMKTGALIRGSVRLGGILGSADDDQMAALTAYGEAAGRVFQLADDMLDVTASTETMGKATGKDSAAGKQTLVSAIGMERAQRHMTVILEEAIDALKGFGPEADGLRATVRYFAERKR